MYSTLPSFVLGFHGCDQSVVDELLFGRDTLRLSENGYDWLGTGAYFWENDPARAFEYAKLLKTHPRGQVTIKQPAVLGAIINLGHCLNLMEVNALRLIISGYNLLCGLSKASGNPLPENTIFDDGGIPLVRKLDCAVIDMLHYTLEQQEEHSFDSVRGLFLEGNEAYPNSGFREKSHVQICVRNPNCIKGFFIPRKRDPDHSLP